MSSAAPLQTVAAKPLRTAGANLTLQRKCACGAGASSLTGECAQCSKKKMVGLQTKLRVNEPGDGYEQEADRVAEQVLAKPAHPDVSSAPPRIQRYTGQTTAQADTVPVSVDHVLASPGRPLDPALQQDMEQRFGHDFSIVRVHTGAQAHDSARSLRALAYTVGNDVVFGTGQYASDTRAGRSLIAHELTHVVQQGGGGGPGHAHRMVQRQPDPAPEKEDEHEKDFGIAGPPQPAPAELPGFGDVAPDAACPPLPTNLGRLAPEPPCPTADADITGERFTFCRASDVFSPGSERPRLITWARSQPATSNFVVHGYASESDGTPAQNVNVSCHRAKRVARELYNTGVRSERIELAARGGTTRFGTGAAKLTLNRVAVVRAEAPAARAAPATLPTDRRALVDLAVGKLTRSEYRLAADAYLSRWTCGRIPSLAEAVRRSVIRIEGEPLATYHTDDPATRRRVPRARMGYPIGLGRNEVVLARETFDEATDPLSCIMARIVDLVSHHMVRDTIPTFSQQHQAAVFLVELAGLPPCHSPEVLGMGGHSEFDWWARPTADPRLGLQPNCGSFAEGPLPGAITPQPATAASLAPAPTFTVRRFSFDGGGGAATVFVHPQAGVDPAKNIAAAGRPPGSGAGFHAVASVVASGNPADAARYQVGFVQTIVSDRLVVDYVGGQRVRFELPVPIRDGPRRDVAAPPWFDPDLVDTVSTPAMTAVTGLSATPWMFFPYHFMDPAQRGRVPNESAEIDHGNVVNRAHKATVFQTWLVARRDDAPLDRFSTHVLDGRMVAWTQRANFIGAAGTGSFDASVDPTPLTDTTDMRLGGPTASELDPTVGATLSPRDQMHSRRVVEVAEAPPKAKAGGLSESDYIKRIQKIAEEIEPLRRALDITDAIRVRIRIVPTTGRVAIHRPPDNAAADAKFDTGETLPSYSAAMSHYAEEIASRARKDLVLGDTRRLTDKGWLPVVIPTIPELKRPADVMSPKRGLSGTKLIEEGRLDVESEDRRAANPGAFDPEFRVPVTVKFETEEYLFDFSLSFDEVQAACRNTGGGAKSASCVVPDVGDRAKLTVDVTVAQEMLGAGVVSSPVAVEVTMSPIAYRLFVPTTGIAFEGMSGPHVTEDSLIHELHHLVYDRELTQILKERLARAVRGRVMALRRLAATDRSMRSGVLAKGAIEAVVWDEYVRYVTDFDKEGDRLSDLLHTSTHYPLLTEAEIQRMWPAFRMPRRVPHKGTFEP